MTRSWVVGFLVMAAACGGTAKQTPAPPAAPAPAEADFPLQAGTEWRYRTVDRAETGQDDQGEPIVKEDSREWSARVLESVEREGARCALVEGLRIGFVSDDQVLLVVVPGQGVFVAEASPANLAHMRDAGASLAALAGEGASLLFPLPIESGKTWACDTDNAPEEAAGGMYCWMVLEILPGQDLAAIRGAPARGTIYRIAYRTQPDHTSFDYVPGAGLVHHESVHHGTVEESFTELVEIRLPR